MAKGTPSISSNLSDADTLLRRLRQNGELSKSQQAEVNKHRIIAEHRNKAAKKKAS